MIKRDKISLILGIHCHQPVGNFGWVIEDAYQKCYRPFLDVLYKYPTIKFAAHYSGPLLEWIESNHPEFFELVRDMVNRGQLEIMGGGFYEPILMIIPEKDRQDQIKRMNDYAEKHLGMRPKGVWLTERIWEPTLPKTLSLAGVKYTVADDSHFVQAGIDRSNVRGYYTTEDEGHTVSVIPIDQHMRYAVPFQVPPKIMRYLRERFDRGDRSCCSLLDDGEKFGVWPGTYELLYTKEFWLDNFFKTLVENSSWLEVTTPIDYLNRFPSEGLVYMPTASYFEMGQWTLNARDNMTLENLKDDLNGSLQDKTEVFVRGGYFRNFFSRYPESNWMHKRMIQVSDKVHAANLSGEDFDAARAALGASQCNCGYWHGVFGGLYLPHLREALYKNMIKAEKLVDRRELACDCYDIDKNGVDEIILRNSKLAAYFSTTDGGSLVELDYLPTESNLGNTLARREEAYHHIKEEPAAATADADSANIHDLKREIKAEDRKILVYDSYPRNAFREHFFSADADTSAEMLLLNSEQEYGDAATAPRMPQISEKSDAIELLLHGNTSVQNGTLAIEKKIRLEKGSSALLAAYTLKWNGQHPTSLKFAVEFNLLAASALGIDTPFRVNGETKDWRLLGIHDAENVKEAALFDPHPNFDIIISCDRPAALASFPVETISQSEAGFDRNYQASSLWFTWRIDMNPHEDVRLNVELKIIER